ncbi:MAG: hypothetical protein J0L93_08700 [Deltaproteobacteria bacterium]|nr:hypothetical protein [Deltaproteobacteria bacterium]
MSFNFQDHPGLPFIIIGMLIVIFAFRRNRARLRDSKSKEINKKNETPWV